MSTQRAQVQFDRANWRLALLLPLWALQLLLATAMMGLFAWRLADSIKQYGRQSEGRSLAVEFAWESANIASSLVVAACTFVEIGRFVADSLTPWIMLFTHAAKLVCAFAVLALDLFVHVRRIEAPYSLVGLGLDAALIITAAAVTVYAILTYRRLLAYDDYSRTVNVKDYGLHDGYYRNGSCSSHMSVGSTIDKQKSLGSFRPNVASASYEPVCLPTTEQTSSFYSHERDTQFDDYVARRSSWNSKVDVERAGSGEWERTSSGEVSPRGCIVMSQGMVKTRSRGPSIGQTMSHTSDHVLVAVPEEAECPDGVAQHERARDGGADGADAPEVMQVVELKDPKWH